ncbi:hypothetical protein AUC69_11680 [Methyloceanibacter superfactus]|jgi:hypothetical protein|uniref:Uncharacterized protein n=1 Tax=Methyloceanibacter superfactus TaxID=1774969 RepID=A0A1E3VW33_9HYPH|nr:hypothetical protein AUC69_11680 [Methyloceanibacter superfactus]
MTPNTPGSTGGPDRGSSFARLAAFSRSVLNEQWVGAAFLIISFVIAQVLVVAMHVQTTKMWADISEVQLARDLYREFYDRDKNYMKVANAIEGCQKLYKGDGGKFSHLEINEYLGFFSDLGLFMDRGLLSEELVGHFFGAFIIEAYEYPEVESYIARIRKNFEQPEAFEDFEKVAKVVESDPRFARLAQFAETMCAKEQEGSPAHE